jgi:hypothetical protein
MRRWLVPVGVLVIAALPTVASTQSPVALPQPLSIDGAVPRVYKSIKGVELRDATVLPLRFNNRAQDGSPFHHLGRDLKAQHTASST